MTDHKRSGNDTYLHQPPGSGGTWYARVTVPRTLCKQVGQTHIRRSLQTTNKAEANRRKHAVVAAIKAELANRRKAPAKPGLPAAGMTFAVAREWREAFQSLEADGDQYTLENLHLAATDKAEEIERLYGTTRAQQWHRVATRTTENLRELMGRWLDGCEFRESTNMGHRKALAEVLSFMGDQDAHPQDLTDKQALTYIDSDLMKRGLAANTIQDRLVSLGGFWKWMETRNVVPRGLNPWKGHRVSKKQHAGTRPPKRKGGFTDSELLHLLGGTAQTRKWPTFAYLPDLMVLGMFSGGRIDSLASLTADRVRAADGGYVVHIENDKTEAGTRPVGFTHPAAVAVLQRRTQGLQGAAQLFPELTPGGADKKLSASASKAFGRYRRACGVADGADFHSFRRNVAGILEEAGFSQGELARFVGHKVGTLAADVYAGPRSATWALEASRNVRFAGPVEAAALALATS